jgi:hypothetical protein
MVVFLGKHIYVCILIILGVALVHKDEELGHHVEGQHPFQLSPQLLAGH